jgi:thymidylate synthase
MADPYFRAQTLDDVMRSVMEEILSHGDGIRASKGWTAELTGVLLEITNPRARLSRTETRGKPFSCLGE